MGEIGGVGGGWLGRWTQCHASVVVTNEWLVFVVGWVDWVHDSFVEGRNGRVDCRARRRLPRSPHQLLTQPCAHAPKNTGTEARSTRPAAPGAATSDRFFVSWSHLVVECCALCTSEVCVRLGECLVAVCSLPTSPFTLSSCDCVTSTRLSFTLENCGGPPRPARITPSGLCWSQGAGR